MEKVELAPNVPHLARDLGIEDPETMIPQMIEFSAPCTHALGNRRYEDYVFKFVDGNVTHICLFDSEDVEEKVEDGVCPDCHDDGNFCLTCGTS